jgi:hypothetical protein
MYSHLIEKADTNMPAGVVAWSISFNSPAGAFRASNARETSYLYAKRSWLAVSKVDPPSEYGMG